VYCPKIGKKEQAIKHNSTENVVCIGHALTRGGEMPMQKWEDGENQPPEFLARKKKLGDDLASNQETLNGLTKEKLHLSGNLRPRQKKYGKKKENGSQPGEREGRES